MHSGDWRYTPDRGYYLDAGEIPRGSQGSHVTDETIAGVRDGVGQLQQLLNNCREELAQAETTEAEAKTSYQYAEAQRLQGLTNGAACDDVLRTVAACRIRTDALRDLERQLVTDVGRAEAVLHEAEAVKATQEARLRFNALVELHVSTAKRLDKSVRELQASVLKMRELCIEQGTVAAALGQSTPWPQVYQRGILGWLGAQLADLARELPEPRGQWQQQLLKLKPWDGTINPFCVPLPTEGEESD